MIGETWSITTDDIDLLDVHRRAEALNDYHQPAIYSRETCERLEQLGRIVPQSLDEITAPTEARLRVHWSQQEREWLEHYKGVLALNENTDMRKFFRRQFLKRLENADYPEDFLGQDDIRWLANQAERALDLAVMLRRLAIRHGYLDEEDKTIALEMSLLPLLELTLPLFKLGSEHG